MLPFDIEEGKDYIDQDGKKIQSLFWSNPAKAFVGYDDIHKRVRLYERNGRGADTTCHLIMPADTWGVYHVSDGDTPLLKSLAEWCSHGGGMEFKHYRSTSWCPAHLSPPLWENGNFYRAAGCTEDREFPQTKPQMPDRVWGGSCTDAGLLAELKAWFANGGEIENRYKNGTTWVTSSPAWSELYYYRAVGCTAEPVIDPPQPPVPPVHVVTCEMMAEAAKDWLGKMCNANWWQQRAQQDSRP